MTTELATQPASSKAPVLADGRGVKFSSMEEMWRFCVAVVNSRQFKDVETPEIALIRLQAGLELGLTPIWSLANIMVTNGRPSVWGDALLGLVLNHPQCVDVIETIEHEGTDKETAVCEVRRKGREPVIRKFGTADAKQAGLTGKGVHGPYPKRMRQMRARAWACRDCFADALRGLGVREELENTEPKPVAGRVVASGIVMPDEPPQLSDARPVSTGESEVVNREAVGHKVEIPSDSTEASSEAKAERQNPTQHKDAPADQDGASEQPERKVDADGNYVW